EIAQGARTGHRLVEPPHLRKLGVGDPLLQVAAAEVVDFAELPRLQHFAGQADRRYEAIVEGTHVRDPGLLRALPDPAALLGRSTERLLAEHVLAGLCGGDRWRRVKLIGRTIVEELTAIIP